MVNVASSGLCGSFVMWNTDRFKMFSKVKQLVNHLLTLWCKCYCVHVTFSWPHFVYKLNGENMKMLHNGAKLLSPTVSVLNPNSDTKRTGCANKYYITSKVENLSDAIIQLISFQTAAEKYPQHQFCGLKNAAAHLCSLHHSNNTSYTLEQQPAWNGFNPVEHNKKVPGWKHRSANSERAVCVHHGWNTSLQDPSQSPHGRRRWRKHSPRQKTQNMLTYLNNAQICLNQIFWSPIFWNRMLHFPLGCDSI